MRKLSAEEIQKLGPLVLEAAAEADLDPANLRLEGGPSSGWDLTGADLELLKKIVELGPVRTPGPFALLTLATGNGLLFADALVPKIFAAIAAAPEDKAPAAHAVRALLRHVFMKAFAVGTVEGMPGAISRKDSVGRERLSFYLDSALNERIRRAAMEAKLSLSDYAAAMLERGLSGEQKTPSRHSQAVSS